MDQGIIFSIKKKTRDLLLSEVVQTMPYRETLRALGKKQKSGNVRLKYCYPAHVLDTIKFIESAVASMDQKGMVNCWIRSSLLSKAHIKKICDNIGRDHTKKFS